MDLIINCASDSFVKSAIASIPGDVAVTDFFLSSKVRIPKAD